MHICFYICIDLYCIFVYIGTHSLIDNSKSPKPPSSHPSQYLCLVKSFFYHQLCKKFDSVFYHEQCRYTVLSISSWFKIAPAGTLTLAKILFIISSLFTFTGSGISGSWLASSENILLLNISNVLLLSCQSSPGL